MKFYYDEDPDNAYNPYRLIVSLENNVIDWNKKLFYISLPDKLEKAFLEGIDEDIMSISVNQGDLLIHPAKANIIGLYLPNVVNRIEKLIASERKQGFINTLEDTTNFYNKINQFIIYISDLTAKGLRINQFFSEDW